MSQEKMNEERKADPDGSTELQDKGVSTSMLVFLIITGLAMLFFYIKFVPEDSSALHPAHRKSGHGSRLEMYPTMHELEKLHWKDKTGMTNDVSILDACAEKQLAEDLKKALGIPDSKITAFVRSQPMSFCRAVFQQWYNDGSITAQGYPINWITLIRALDEVGLRDVAKKANAALHV